MSWNAFLTDRSYDDVNCDDRHLALVTDLGIYIDEYGATLTDTLRDALASADGETLQAASSHWPLAGELTPLARSAAAAGERLYVRWSAHMETSCRGAPWTICDTATTTSHSTSRRPRKFVVPAEQAMQRPRPIDDLDQIQT